MASVYIYGGYILTGGKLQNNQDWRGVNVMIAEKKNGDEFPYYATVVKGQLSDSLLKSLREIPIGCPISVSFVPAGNDKNGAPVFKLSEIRRMS